MVSRSCKPIDVRRVKLVLKENLVIRFGVLLQNLKLDFRPIADFVDLGGHFNPFSIVLRLVSIELSAETKRAHPH